MDLFDGVRTAAVAEPRNDSVTPAEFHQDCDGIALCRLVRKCRPGCDIGQRAGRDIGVDQRNAPLHTRRQPPTLDRGEMLADTVDVADLQSGGDESLVDVDEIAFVEPWSERLLDACGSAAGDEEEDLVMRGDEVEQLTAGREAGGSDVRMTTFDNR